MPRNVLVSALLLACALPALGCSGDRRQKPDVSLAAGIGPQAEFRTLRTHFFDAQAEGRVALTPLLTNFLARYPDDPRAQDVRVYLAWCELENGERDAALITLRPLLGGDRGTVRDFARVAEAAVLARQGELERALTLLDTLDGRIVDLDERFVYGEERARTAFMAHRYDVGVRAMLAWLSQAPPDRQARAQASAEKLLELLPASEALVALAAFRDAKPGELNAALVSVRVWAQSSMLARLTRLALTRQDATLARRILDTAPAALRGTPEGQRLVELASAGNRAPAVAGRAVGLLLGLGQGVERRRAVAVTAGMTRVLGSAAAPEKASGVELVVRYVSDDDVDTALTELAAEGAALLVSGSDDATARLVAARADVTKIPLLLVRPLDKAPEPTGFTFVIGESDAATEARLASALAARGHVHPARIGPGGVSCDSEAVQAGQGRFPLAALKKEGVDSLLVTGDAACARDLARELAHLREPWPLALAFDASEAYGTLSGSAFVPQSGAYPDAAPTAGWYEALGHDAAVLATRALEALPESGIARGGDVETLRAKVRDALARARAELWTSSARGFDGARLLPRDLVVRAPASRPHTLSPATRR
jgi:hypothetical protein